MPKKYPNYPYFEPLACGLSDAEIDATVADMFAQNPGVSLKDGGPLDGLCRALNIDVEYSAPPNEVLVDVPLEGRPVIWLNNNGRTRHDRVTLAMGIGYWLLHVPLTREAHPGAGIQALYSTVEDEATIEARKFAFELLMPKQVFKSLWYEGRAQLTSNTLNVPTQVVYDRAKILMLSPDPDVSTTEADLHAPPEAGMLSI